MNQFKIADDMLYSRGVYWLFEHWQESGNNIYSKAKYSTQDEFLDGAGKYLTSDEIVKLKKGDSIIIPREDRTKFFFKFVNNP